MEQSKEGGLFSLEASTVWKRLSESVVIFYVHGFKQKNHLLEKLAFWLKIEKNNVQSVVSLDRLFS